MKQSVLSPALQDAMFSVGLLSMFVGAVVVSYLFKDWWDN